MQADQQSVIYRNQTFIGNNKKLKKTKTGTL
jgi:hypothetical protein